MFITMIALEALAKNLYSHHLCVSVFLPQNFPEPQNANLHYVIWHLHFQFFSSSRLVSIKVPWRLQSRTVLCKISPSNPHRQLSLSFQTPSKQVWSLMHFICLLLIYDIIPGSWPGQCIFYGKST